MAVRQDATGDIIQRTANLPATSAMSACGWAYLTTDRNAFSGICMLESAAGYVYLGTNATGTQLYVEHTSSSSLNLVDLATATWFFWAVTAQNLQAVQGYYAVPGAASLTNQATPGGLTSFTPTSFRLCNTDAGDWWNGRIAYVKVWDAVLTAAELFAEMSNGRPQRLANLRYFWPLIDSSDNRDLSSNGWGPTLTSVTSEAGPPIEFYPSRPFAEFVSASALSSALVFPPAAIVRTPTTRFRLKAGDPQLLFPATPAPGAFPLLAPALTRTTEYRIQRLIHNEHYPQTPFIEVGYVPLLPQRNIRHSGRH